MCDSQEGVVDAAVTVNVSVVNNDNSGGSSSSTEAVSKQVEEEEEEPYLSDSSDEDEEKAPPPPSAWQLFCEEHLSATQAIAVLKVQSTSGAKS